MCKFFRDWYESKGGINSNLSSFKSQLFFICFPSEWRKYQFYHGSSVCYIWSLKCIEMHLIVFPVFKWLSKLWCDDIAFLKTTCNLNGANDNEIGSTLQQYSFCLRYEINLTFLDEYFSWASYRRPFIVILIWVNIISYWREKNNVYVSNLVLKQNKDNK